MRQAKCDLDLTGGHKPRVVVKVDLGDGPKVLELLEPRRREVRVMSLLGEAARKSGEDPDGYVNALYVAASAILSRNSEGVEYGFAQVSDALGVSEAEQVAAAYARLKAAQEESLGNA